MLKSKTIFFLKTAGDTVIFCIGNQELELERWKGIAECYVLYIIFIYYNYVLYYVSFTEISVE